MIISHKHKFIYLRTPKTASSSVFLLFERFCGDDDIVTHINEEFLPGFEYKSRNTDGLGKIPNHCSADFARNIVGEKLFKKYFVFTCVRNPWDREVSSYWHRVKKISKGKIWDTKDKKEWSPDEDFDPTKVIDFKKHLKLNFFGNYEPYYKIDKKIITDGIIKFENLEDCSKKILRHLGINIRSSLPLVLPTAKTNISPKFTNYKLYYDDFTKGFVYGKYYNDIKTFKYRFKA